MIKHPRNVIAVHVAVLPLFILLLLLVSHTALLASAALLTCSDNECRTCVTDVSPPGACRAANGVSAMYVCDATHGNVTLFNWANDECLGTARSSVDIGIGGTCITVGAGSFMATCGSAGAAATIIGILVPLLALLLF